MIKIKILSKGNIKLYYIVYQGKVYSNDIENFTLDYFNTQTFFYCSFRVFYNLHLFFTAHYKLNDAQYKIL